MRQNILSWLRKGLLLKPKLLKHFSRFRILLRKTRLSHLTFFFTETNSILPAISGPAALQTSHYIINVVTGIINEPRKLWLPDIMEFALSTFRTRNSSFFLAWYFRGYCINRPALWYVNSNQFIFSEKICMKVFDFCLSWSLVSVKSTWFKTSMSESILQFKKQEYQSRILKWKIRSVMEWKCSENIISPSGNAYQFFTRILQNNSQMRVF